MRTQLRGGKEDEENEEDEEEMMKPMKTEGEEEEEEERLTEKDSASGPPGHSFRLSRLRGVRRGSRSRNAFRMTTLLNHSLRTRSN